MVNCQISVQDELRVAQDELVQANVERGIFGARTFGVGTFGAAGTFCEVEKTLVELGTVVKNVLTGKDGISVYLCPADNEERVDKTMEATPVIAIYMLKDIYKVTCSD
ncbi:hypothetical protein Tco_0194367 [Tanacetum coccineum]